MTAPVLDPAPLDALADDLGGPHAVAALLATFCDSVVVLRDSAAHAWRTDDLEALRRSLRDLASSAGMFGAQRLSGTARDLARRVGSDAHDVSGQEVAELEALCVQVVREVRTWLEATAYDVAH